ncbi:MAG: aldo/keto reductase [Mycobacterium sp.]
MLSAADELGVPAAEVAVAYLLERGRRSPTGVVPIIGPRTPAQLGSYVSALDLVLGDETYAKLDAVSAPSLGQPYDQLATEKAAPLGGDVAAFRRHPVPTA